MTRRYNWKPDAPDFRDIPYKLIAPSPLPVRIDLRTSCPPIVDQGQIGSCTGNALAGALGFLEKRIGGAFEPFSRLFIYYNERVMEGDPDYDGGAQIRDGIKSLAKQGACYETDWIYDPNNVFVKPGDQAYKDALQHAITDYQSLDNTDPNQLKDCLANGYPFVFGFTVYSSFEDPEVARTGVMQMPSFLESPVGGHAVVCVGYDDESSVFIVRNSWGSLWGDEGYFYMPYAYMQDPDLVDSAWRITR